jgi:hypothetical protein
MPANPNTQRMAELHEIYLADEVFGGTKTKASGSQWTDPADGANHHDEPFAFRWDGKSTRGRQIAVTQEMITKICEQAGGERPALAFRWYGNDALTQVLQDWVAVKGADFAELLEAARESMRLRAELENTREAHEEALEALRVMRDCLSLVVAERDHYRTKANAAGATGSGGFAGTAGAAGGGGGGSPVNFRNVTVDLDSGRQVPEYIPRLPWTIVNQVHLPGRIEIGGVHYDAAGHQQPFKARSVIVERSLGSGNRPRLVVNDSRVSNGDLYVDGVLRARVADDQPQIEVG